MAEVFENLKKVIDLYEYKHKEKVVIQKNTIFFSKPFILESVILTKKEMLAFQNYLSDIDV